MFSNPHALPLTLILLPLGSSGIWGHMIKLINVAKVKKSHLNSPAQLCYYITRCTESKGRGDSPMSISNHNFQIFPDYC